VSRAIKRSSRISINSDRRFGNLLSPRYLLRHAGCGAGHRSQVTGHRSQVTGHRSQVTGHRSQVTGHRISKRYEQSANQIIGLLISGTGRIGNADPYPSWHCLFYIGYAVPNTNIPMGSQPHPKTSPPLPSIRPNDVSDYASHSLPLPSYFESHRR